MQTHFHASFAQSLQRSAPLTILDPESATTIIMMDSYGLIINMAAEANSLIVYTFQSARKFVYTQEIQARDSNNYHNAI